MIYIFENGRMISDKNMLLPEDEGHFITIEVLPEIKPLGDRVGIITGCNLETRELIIEYFANYVPELTPQQPISLEPIPQPASIELLMQAFSDAEIRDLEAQEERKLLAQQMTDIEVALFGGDK